MPVFVELGARFYVSGYRTNNKPENLLKLNFYKNSGLPEGAESVLPRALEKLISDTFGNSGMPVASIHRDCRRNRV